MYLTIMTFNIRYSGAKDGINCWTNRKALVNQIIMKYQPDIIGFQEVLTDQLADLTTSLPLYHNFGTGRSDGQDSGERVPIFYRGFNLIQKGQFWMSNTPDRPGRPWGLLPRICTWGHFQTSKGFCFAVYNTHLDHKFEKLRYRSAKLILKHIITHSSAIPAILIGDFNTNLKSQTYQIINKELRDVFTEIPGSRSSQMVTFHNYSDPSINQFLDKDAKWIDYIFVGKAISIHQVHVIKDYYTIDPTLFPSDHWPLFAELDINEEKKE